MAWYGIGLNYTYKEILNALKTKGRCKYISLHTKYNRVPLGFDPSVARLLGHDPTPRPTCPVRVYIQKLDL